MNRVIKYSILYDYKKLNLRIITMFGLILLSFIIYAGREYVYLNRHVSDTANMWDFYSFVFIDSNILVSVLIFSSLYFIFNSFQNNKKDMFIKIRVNNFLTWFTSKIISNFIFNFISITLATIFALAIGIIISGYGLNWSSVAHRLRVYSKFYNPIEFAGINIVTYSLFVTFLAILLGVLIVKVKNEKIAVIVSIIYISVERYTALLGEKLVNILKYFSLDSYVGFRRNYFTSGLQYQINYVTVRESITIPFVLITVTYILIIYLYKKGRFGSSQG